MTKYDRHIFLYAKGHYQKNDLIEDMKIIMSERNGIDAEHITTSDIIYVLTKITYNFINTERDFLIFMDDINPSNKWKFTSDEYNFEESIISKCLSILRWQKVIDIPFEISKPDPNILPLRIKNE